MFHIVFPEHWENARDQNCSRHLQEDLPLRFVDPKIGSKCN